MQFFIFVPFYFSFGCLREYLIINMKNQTKIKNKNFIKVLPRVELVPYDNKSAQFTLRLNTIIHSDVLYRKYKNRPRHNLTTTREYFSKLVFLNKRKSRTQYMSKDIVTSILDLDNMTWGKRYKGVVE